MTGSAMTQNARYDLIPLLPMTFAMLIGTAIYALTSRMRKKNIMQILFSLIFFVAYFFFMQNINGSDEKIFADITEMMLTIKGIYLPASWFGSGVWGNIPMYLLFIGVSIGVFAVFAYVTGKIFQPICFLRCLDG